MARYPKDPYWLTARFDGKCEKCGAAIKRGERIFYYPLTRSTFSGECAKAADRDFTSLAAAEDGEWFA